MSLRNRKHDLGKGKAGAVVIKEQCYSKVNFTTDELLFQKKMY